MRIVDEELETPHERYVRIRDECLDIIWHRSKDDEAYKNAKATLHDEFERWWNTL